ncbi:MAG: YbhB/YbcL family Raf kinase inhibitor-like protein [Raoultibacter sp.]
MLVVSSGIQDGYFADEYGKRGTEQNVNGMPTRSIPFSISDAPVETKSFAIVLEDKDAYPVSGGFVWIHWLAANIKRMDVAAGESQTATDFVQGVNSWTSIQGGQQSAELSTFYGGMCPPDAPHLYELQVYALDCVLDLENGFLLNELFHAMDGHILEHATLKALYSHEEGE